MKIRRVAIVLSFAVSACGFVLPPVFTDSLGKWQARRARTLSTRAVSTVIKDQNLLSTSDLDNIGINSNPGGEWDASFFSPGKINLFLRILGKRPDGFHELASLFQVMEWVLLVSTLFCQCLRVTFLDPFHTVRRYKY